MADVSTTRLEYHPLARGSDSSAGIGAIVALPFLLALILTVLGFGVFAWPGAIAIVVFLWIRARNSSKRWQAVLTIDQGQLLVEVRKPQVYSKVALDELLDVSLDTKTIQRVQENMRTGVPDVRFIDSSVRPEQDISRIELETSSESILLSEDYFSSTDSTEWLGTIRRFLRANGWVPNAERVTAAKANEI